jgi:hypothetical protein
MIFERDLKTILREITLNAILELVKFENQFPDIFLQLLGAGMTRLSVQAVQFERFQSIEHFDERESIELTFKLSSQFLCSYDGDDIGLTDLAWKFTLPALNREEGLERSFEDICSEGLVEILVCDWASEVTAAICENYY